VHRTRWQGDGGAVVRAGPRAAAAEVPLGAGRPDGDGGVGQPAGGPGGGERDAGFPVDVLGLPPVPARPMGPGVAAAARRALAAARELRRGHDTRGATPARRAGLHGGLDSIAYERPHYPVGRYRFTDARVQNGFDYHYVVTAVAQRQIVITGTTRTDLLESPFRAVFSGIVRPRTEAGASYRDGKVWVVPNPFRQDSPWDRAPGAGRRVHTARGLHGAATRALEDPHLHRWRATWCRRSRTTARAATASTRGT
jgi:hypothetical protein